VASFGGVRWCIIASDFDFIGGSMGAAAGERIVRAYDRAATEQAPVLVLAASGGARMQEGMVALIQMARTAAAARRHADAGLLQVAYLASPTTGGVYASFASLADLIWADPGATIGFAGPRVVEQTTGAPLPAGAHTAESAGDAGLIDNRMSLSSAGFKLARLAPVVERSESQLMPPAPTFVRGTRDMAYAQVQAVRAQDWVDIFDVAHNPAVEFIAQMRGDRAGGKGWATEAALGMTVGGRAVVAIVLRPVPRPRPADYRLARRAVALAARLRLPVVTFVDSPGADPSHESEQAGIAGEIARLMAAIATHPAPTVSIVTGEGGSGGALAFAACDRLYLLDGAVFSVIAPEGAAAILYRDALRAAEVAPFLKLTGPDLLEFGIIDGIVARDDVAHAIDHALATAQPGDGLTRFDTATRRAIVEPPDA
jgi:acetyl-CoA carboxylase carboxyl transferase subunit beta